MVERKRKNKPGAGRPHSGRDYFIKCRVLTEVGEQIATQAKIEGWGPLIERLWRESQGIHHPPA